MKDPSKKQCWHTRCLALLCMAAVFSALDVCTARAQQSSTIQIIGYNMDVTLDPANHSIRAQTAVTFTAIANLTSVSFALSPRIGDVGVKDASGQPLIAARSSEGTGSIHVTPPAPMQRGHTATWTFQYTGVFTPDVTKGGPAHPAAQLASIGDPVSYLLYGAQWFPVDGYMTDRFTASIHVHVPAGVHVFGSGLTGSPHLDSNGQMIFDFIWLQPGFPGTIIAGKFRDPYLAHENPKVHVYLLDGKFSRVDGQKYAALAAQEYGFFTSRFGPTATKQLNIIELPEGATPAYSAPEMALLAGLQIQGENSSRLLANTIAHQWWGNAVSPATLDDAWITNGMCRYAELEYLDHSVQAAVFKDAVLNVSASALAYDSVQLADSAHYPTSTPEFQALTYDKGAMIFRMLRWQIGDAAFEQTLRGILALTSHTVASSDVEKIAEAASHQDLRPFFLQWLNNTGAPTLRDNWTLYRLGNNKGFRTVGQIGQDLDLYRMPVEVMVETASKTVTRRVEVAGPQTQYVIETPEIPRKILLDPDRWLLRNDPDMQVRVHILRGQQLAEQNKFSVAIQEYRRALAINDVSSLASFRLGEVYFRQLNFQAAAAAFRDALHGDDDPKWTEVWSDLELGKIFDASGQRERAVNQYREAVQTGDNTGGALEQARSYIEHPFQPPSPPAR